MATRNVILSIGSGPDQVSTKGSMQVRRVYRGPDGDGVLIFDVIELVEWDGAPASEALEVGQYYVFTPVDPKGDPITANIPAGAGDILISELVPVNPRTLEPSAEAPPAWFVDLQQVQAALAEKQDKSALDEDSALLVDTPGSELDTALTAKIEADTSGKANSADVYSKVAADAAILAAGTYPVARRPWPPQMSKVLAHTQSGHGWTNTNTALFQSDVTNKILGAQCLMFQPTISSGAAYIQKGSLSFDATGKALRVWLQLTLPVAHTLKFYAGDSTMANAYVWTITTAGAAVPTCIFQGAEWIPLTLNWQDAVVVGSPSRASLTTLRLESTAAGGSATQVRLNAVELVDQPSVGVVSFTFDDGYDTSYNKAKPIFDKAGYSATAFVIADQIGSATFCTVAQLLELQNNSGWEIASHAFTLAHHDAPLDTLPLHDLEEDFRAMKAWLIDNGFRGGDQLAYPQGRVSVAMQPLVENYFATARTTAGKTAETQRPGKPPKLRSMIIENTTTVSAMNAAIDAAIAQGGWIIFTLHKIVDVPTATNHFATANLQSVVDHCVSSGARVRTVGQVVAGDA